MEKKALFLDLDGTLLTDRKEITPGNRNAIERMLSLGHQVIITTGRPLVSALTQAERLGFNRPGCRLICFNGGILYDVYGKKMLEHSTLSLEDTFRLFDEANHRGIHIHTYDEESVLVEPLNDTYRVIRYCDTTLMHYRVIPDIRQLSRAPEKCFLIEYDEQERLDEFREWVLSWAGDRLAGVKSAPYYLEILPKDSNKGTALLKMAELLGIPVENTVSAGDAENDMAMILAAGTGAAMINGTPEVRAAADYVTERDNNHDCVAEIIERFIL